MTPSEAKEYLLNELVRRGHDVERVYAFTPSYWCKKCGYVYNLGGPNNKIVDKIFVNNQECATFGKANKSPGVYIAANFETCNEMIIKGIIK